MNSYITPNEFAGISMFDDEHSLAEKATTAAYRWSIEEAKRDS